MMTVHNDSKWSHQCIVFYFKVYGGNDASNSAKYHPFYITDSPIGGYDDKTAEEKAKTKIYAGEKSELCYYIII